MLEFTLVLGVDKAHLEQLSWTIETWRKHKPRLWDVPWCVFYDHAEINEEQVYEVVPSWSRLVQWPLDDVRYTGDPEGPKWQRPQRHKMLAGFVHVPAVAVHTRYWLKLDTDVVATGNRDWIDQSWFKDWPAIVSHKWSFTKPANQMLILDQWVDKNRDSLGALANRPPLNLQPVDGAERIGHGRIISWCGFFDSTTTRLAARYANETVGEYQLPVPSQDGYLWYVAERLGMQIKRVNMKALGWQQWSTSANIQAGVKDALRRCDVR